LIRCPQCGEQENMPDSALGKMGECNVCRCRFQIRPPPLDWKQEEQVSWWKKEQLKERAPDIVALLSTSAREDFDRTRRNFQSLLAGLSGLLKHKSTNSKEFLVEATKFQYDLILVHDVLGNDSFWESSEVTPGTIEITDKGGQACAGFLCGHDVAGHLVCFKNCLYDVSAECSREEAKFLVREVHAQLVAEVEHQNRRRIPQSVRDEVWRRDEGRCRECGSRDKLEYDHIVPISKGGSNTARNVELLCEHCNRSKADKIG
jgi:5-methylcytosine-specific restriction endonuclease McrA